MDFYYKIYGRKNCRLWGYVGLREAIRIKLPSYKYIKLSELNYLLKNTKEMSLSRACIDSMTILSCKGPNLWKYGMKPVRIFSMKLSYCKDSACQGEGWFFLEPYKETTIHFSNVFSDRSHIWDLIWGQELNFSPSWGSKQRASLRVEQLTGENPESVRW